MPPQARSRSVAVRVTIPAEAWAYFVILRDHLRHSSSRSDRKLKIHAGDQGTRRVLRGWLESELQRLAESLQEA